MRLLSSLLPPALALITLFAAAEAAPPAPAGFAAAPPTVCGAIKLTWIPVAGVTGYHIYRGGVRLTSLQQAATVYYDYEMPGPAAYVYGIESFDETGVSPMAVDGSAVLAPTLWVDPWDWFHDVFPTTEAVPGTPAFVRATAKIRTGRNLAPLVGIVGREVTPGSNVVVHAPGALSVDILYRIKPGPGNYTVEGLTATGLLWDPAVPAGPVACPGDASYWGPTIELPACPGIGVWDIDEWITVTLDPIGGGDHTTTSGGDPIFPDDLFTPGTVVQYYFKAHYAGGGSLTIPNPDCAMQVAGQNSLDGHRWEQFTVLPDLWKDPAFGGLGLPCALVVDLEDGRGNERIWNGAADSLAATAPSARGAYNGWRAPSYDPVNIANPVDQDSPAYWSFLSNGAAGTTWDLYSVRGWQSHALGNAGALGGRLGVVPAGSFPPGPTPAMLKTYYKILVLLSGDRDADILGPLVDRSQDDIALIEDFLGSGTEADHKGILTIGNGFIQSEAINHAGFPLPFLQTGLMHASYGTFAGNPNDCAAMTPTSVTTANGDIYGITKPASSDVLFAGDDGVSAGFYEDIGLAPGAGPFVASVFKDAMPGEQWQALTEGWNIRDLNGRFCGGNPGRLAHYYDVFNNIFGKICSFCGPPPVTLDVPGPRSAAPDATLEVRNNPLRAGVAELHFALAGPERVEAAVYDLAGRKVRTIPPRSYGAGQHAIPWDGRDDAGHTVARGMYSMRLRFHDSDLSGARKIVMLR